MLMFFKNLGKKVKSRKGYTLTELIVVVAILGILAAVATPMVLNQVQKSRDAADAASAKSIETAVQLCLADGSLKVDETNNIVFGTPASGSTATDIKSAVKEKIVGHEYPKVQNGSITTWYLDLKSGKVSTTGSGLTVLYP